MAKEIEIYGNSLEAILNDEKNFKNKLVLVRLFRVYKKLGLEYEKEDFVRAGLKVKTHYFKSENEIETGFFVSLDSGNEICYVLLGLPDICPADNPAFFDMDPAYVKKAEGYLEEGRGVSILIPHLYGGFTHLIEGEFMDIATKEIMTKPTSLNINFKGIYTDNGLKTLYELEKLCRLMDSNKKSKVYKPL